MVEIGSLFSLVHRSVKIVFQFGRVGRADFFLSYGAIETNTAHEKGSKGTVLGVSQMERIPVA